MSNRGLLASELENWEKRERKSSNMALNTGIRPRRPLLLTHQISISIHTIPCFSVYARSACRLTSIPQYTLRDHPITYSTGVSLLSERTFGASGVTLNSGPTRWIIITPSMEPSRLLCISNHHILRSAVCIYALLVLPCPCSIPRIHALCYPELPCTYTARLAPPHTTIITIIVVCLLSISA